MALLAKGIQCFDGLQSRTLILVATCRQLFQEDGMDLGINTLLCRQRLGQDHLKIGVNKKLKAAPILGFGHV